MNLGGSSCDRSRPRSPVLGRSPPTSSAPRTIDAEHSSAGFKVRHMMISTVRGHFDDIEGAFSLAPDGSLEAAATIKAKSINTGNRERDEHLRTNDFLGADTYPEMTFVASGIELKSADRGLVAGDLTIKGTTRPVTLEVELNGYTPRDWKGRPRLSLTATTTINRRDFGVNWNRRWRRAACWSATRSSSSSRSRP